MKNRILHVLMLLIASTGISALAGRPISQTELPKTAQTILSTYYADDGIRKVEQDSGKRGVEYEVDLISGAEIEFIEDGNWKDIKAAHGAAVPSGLIPAGIAAYVASEFKGLTIVEISRKRGGFEVELSNGSELRLTSEGKPMAPRNR